MQKIKVKAENMGISKRVKKKKVKNTLKDLVEIELLYYPARNTKYTPWNTKILSAHLYSLQHCVYNSQNLQIA